MEAGDKVNCGLLLTSISWETGESGHDMFDYVNLCSLQYCPLVQDIPGISILFALLITAC